MPRVGDVRVGVGPLGGVHAALTRSAGAILVVAWDMPFVPPALLGYLRRLGDEGAIAVVPENGDGRLEPTCAYYSGKCVEPLEAWLDGGRSGAAAFLNACAGVRRVSVDEVSPFGDPARLFLSVNTAAALRRADALAALG